MDTMNLTPEQQEKARACRTSDELFALAQTEGIELTEDQLDSVAAGDYGGQEANTCSGHGCDVYDCYCYFCTSVNCGENNCENHWVIGGGN